MDRWSAFSRCRGVACADGGDKLPRRGQADLFADGGEWLRVPGGRVDQLHRGLAACFSRTARRRTLYGRFCFRREIFEFS